MYLLTMWLCYCAQMDLQRLLDFIASDQENSPQEAILELPSEPDATEEATPSNSKSDGSFSESSSDGESNSESDGSFSESSSEPGTPDVSADEEIGTDDAAASAAAAAAAPAAAPSEETPGGGSRKRQFQVSGNIFERHQSRRGKVTFLVNCVGEGVCWMNSTEGLNTQWLTQLDKKPAVQSKFFQGGAWAGLHEIWRPNIRGTPTKMRYNGYHWHGWVANQWVFLSPVWVTDYYTNEFVEKCRSNPHAVVRVGIGASAVQTTTRHCSVVADEQRAVPLLYLQNGQDSCVFASAASAMSWIGAVDQFGQKIDPMIMNQYNTASEDRFMQLNNFVYNNIKGWKCRKIKCFEPLSTFATYPVVIQFVASDGFDRHVITIVRNMIFDGNQPYALKLSKQNLDKCCIDKGTTYKKVRRALLLIPGGKAAKGMALE